MYKIYNRKRSKASRSFLIGGALILLISVILFSCKTAKNDSTQSSATSVSKNQAVKNNDEHESLKNNGSNKPKDAKNNDKNRAASTADILEKMKAAKETDFPSDHLSPDNLSFVKRSNIDLNGDGAKETITVKNIDGSVQFTLSVNTKSISDEFESGESFDGFAIIDINKSDKYKEIAVHTPGPSDDDEYLIYWYDGASIKKVGHIGRWPRFTGYGIIYVDGWISFWQNTDKYILTKQRTLQPVSQPFHYVGVKCKVKKSFPVFLSQNSNKVVANLRTGSTIFIVVGDLSGIPSGDYDNWYLVRSESNLVGWVRESNLVPNTDLQVAD